MYCVDIESSVVLDDLIICPKCQTLHMKIELPKSSSAFCDNCGAVLYRYDDRMITKGLALSITGIILFVVANLFPLVKVELLGHSEYVTIVSMIFTLFENNFYILGTVVSFLVFIFPFLILLIYFSFMVLLNTKRGKGETKELLILLHKILPWSMIEIYVVSILVALVKLVGYMDIDFGVSFWALVLFMILDTYLSKSLHIGELWELRWRIYHGS